MKITFAQFWNNVAALIVTLVVIGFLSLAGKALISEHQIQRYYLESRARVQGADHELVIVSDREWAPDGEIILDRSVTYDQSILLVEKMNIKLAKKKK